MTIDPKTRAESLPCWRGPVAAEPLPGGMTNTNFVVRDRGERFVVRIGDDIPVQVLLRSPTIAAMTGKIHDLLAGREMTID